jgi:predicted metal-dependent hydrolase
MNSTVPPEEFWQGVEQFNRQDFYACHDTLEALWMEASEPDKRFYQGVLQTAVGCYHLGNLNWRGAVILLGEGIKRLRDYQPTYEGIDVTQLLEQSVELLQALQAIEPEQVGEFVKERSPHEASQDSNLSGARLDYLPRIQRVDT